MGIINILAGNNANLHVMRLLPIFVIMAEVKQTKQDKIIKRNERIRKRFAYYTDKKHYDSNYALELLTDEYLPLEKETIWLIIRRTGHYKNL
ncbi:hypothetical protein [Chryseobacterium lathyri]|nr:hypothetical protein [Chryseobacterium lathyri]